MNENIKTPFPHKHIDKPGYIKVLYFASLREATKIDDELIELTTLDTPFTVYMRLKSRYSFSSDIRSMRAAINHQFVSMDCPLKDTDCLAFIPPVNGG